MLRRYTTRHPSDCALMGSFRTRRLQLECLESRKLLSLNGNQLFPADSPWNRRINDAPLADNSAALINSIGASAKMHPDFGTVWEGANIGIPYNVVSGTQAKLPVVVDGWPGESDLLDVPIPPNAVIEGDPLPSSQNTGDRHLLVYDKDNNVVYELFYARRPSETSDGKWHASSEAVWNMNVNSFRTPGDTSADAAGLPILPGLVRPDEVLDQGVINHALRFTVPRSRDEYVFPASHDAGSANVAYPRMGERFRLKQSFDISGFSAPNRVILQALKDYGMIVADNGSSWYLSGSPSSRWDDDVLGELKSIAGSNFEAVDLTPLVTSLTTTSGSTAGGTQVTVRGQNFSGNAGNLAVLFGNTPATQVSIQSDGTLVATAPAHAAGTVDVTVQTPYGTSDVVPGDRFTYAATAAAAVQGVRLFYKGSPKWDVTTATMPGFSDDNAIATDKSAYLPGGGASTFANVSSYTNGINGIMIDLAGAHGALTAADFVFKTGNNNSPNTWSPAPAPTLVTTRAGAGTSGSDRVELVWADGAIRNTWLEVRLRGNDTLGGLDTNTGLASTYVFFFGSAVADSGAGNMGSYMVNSADEISARSDPHGPGNPAAITNVNDFNRDGQVNSTDQITARSNKTVVGMELKVLNVGAGGPFGPEAASAEADNPAAVAIASALAAGASAGSRVGVFGSLSSSVQTIDSAMLDPRATYFTRLGSDNGIFPDDQPTELEPSPRAADDDLLGWLVEGL
jgi:hypothetical protein